MVQANFQLRAYYQLALNTRAPSLGSTTKVIRAFMEFSSLSFQCLWPKYRYSLQNPLSIHADTICELYMDANFA